MRSDDKRDGSQRANEETEMHQVLRADQIELADAIAEGADAGPARRSANISPTRAARARSAPAYEGAYALPQEAGSIRPRLDRLFDCLENVRRRAARKAATSGCRSTRSSCTSTTIITGRASRSSRGCRK